MSLERHAAGIPCGEHSLEDKMSKFVTQFLNDESGATAIEYGLIVALIAVIIIGAVGAIGTKLNANFGAVRDQIPTPQSKSHHLYPSIDAATSPPTPGIDPLAIRFG